MDTFKPIDHEMYLLMGYEGTEGKGVYVKVLSTKEECEEFRNVRFDGCF